MPLTGTRADHVLDVHWPSGTSLLMSLQKNVAKDAAGRKKKKKSYDIYPLGTIDFFISTHFL